MLAPGSDVHPGATLTVWTTTEPYHAPVATASTAFDPVPGTWTVTDTDLPAAEAAQVTGFRFVVDLPDASPWLTGQTVRIGWSMVAPEGDAAEGTDAWNSFAFRVQPAGSALPLTSVPLKAGVRFATPTYAVGDTVWLDADRDGRQGEGEPGVPGVRVDLYRAGGSGPWATTTTDAQGRYMFDLVPEGTWSIGYVLSEDQLARYRFTQAHAGGDGRLDSDAIETADPAVARSTEFELGAGAANAFQRVAENGDGVAAGHLDPSRDAGLVELPVSIGDRVWFDTDGNGLQDEGEPGIGGVVLVVRTLDGRPVHDVTGSLVGPQVTDRHGDYLFDGLPPGRYRVEIDREASARALAGHVPTLHRQGGDRALDSSTWSALSRLLVGGEEDLTLDFGFVLATDPGEPGEPGDGDEDEPTGGGSVPPADQPSEDGQAGGTGGGSSPTLDRLPWTGAGGVLALGVLALLAGAAGAGSLVLAHRRRQGFR